MAGDVRYMLGRSLDVVRSLPAASVDLVLCSPPFLKQRAYLPDDHPDKEAEVGQEAGPGEFVDALLDHVEGWRRILAPHGSMVVELGDKYSGVGSAGGDYSAHGFRAQNPRPNQTSGGDGYPEDKSLCLTPELFRIALAYGRNPITGRTTDRWKVRNVVRWCRPNPSPGQLFDKFKPATSEMVVACTSKTRWWDDIACRVRSDRADETTAVTERRKARAVPGSGPDGTNDVIEQNPAGAPLRDYWWFDDVWPDDAWLQSSSRYQDAHYATWPEDLLRRPIEAMCPFHVCTVCGAPRRRIVETTNAKGVGFAKNRQPGNERGDAPAYDVAELITVGWTDCGHDSWRPGVVLDPFAGTGSTLAVAVGTGRDAWGIDFDERNVDLATNRLGLFMRMEDMRHLSEPGAHAIDAFIAENIA